MKYIVLSFLSTKPFGRLVWYAFISIFLSVGHILIILNEPKSNDLNPKSFKKIMATNQENYTLAPVESTMVCEILEDLQKRLSLIKFATVKCEIGAKTDLTEQSLVPAADPSLLTVQGQHEDKSVIIANGGSLSNSGGSSLDQNLVPFSLEYSRLETELKKMESFSSKPKKHKTPTLADVKKVKGAKFVENVDLILNIIQKTKISLEEANNFTILKEETDKIYEMLNRDNKLEEDVEHAKESISKLKDEILKTKEEKIIEEQKLVGEINRLKDEYHILRKEGDETQEIAGMYFDAQRSNMETKHRHKMSVEQEKISKIEKQIDRDVHCLAVMDAWTEDFCEKIERKIDEWKLKMRRDEMIMEMRVEGKKRAIKAQEELIQSLNETIAERLEELAPWEAEKEVERQERLAHMRRYYSCRKIQRWWRSHMVKLKLYRRRKVKP